MFKRKHLFLTLLVAVVFMAATSLGAVTIHSGMASGDCFASSVSGDHCPSVNILGMANFHAEGYSDLISTVLSGSLLTLFALGLLALVVASFLNQRFLISLRYCQISDIQRLHGSVPKKTFQILDWLSLHEASPFVR